MSTRIIAANIHHITNEIEIVVIREDVGMLCDEDIIYTIFIDADKAVLEGKKFTTD